MANYWVKAGDAGADTGTFADPFASIQSAMDVYVAGDNVYLIESTETLATAITVTRSGSTQNYARFIPCDTSGNIDWSKRYTLDASSTAANCLYFNANCAYIHFAGLELINSTNSNVAHNSSYSSQAIIFYQCNMDDSASLGLTTTYLLCYLINCTINGNAAYGVAGSNTNANGHGCQLMYNGTRGVGSAGTNRVWTDSLFHGNNNRGYEYDLLLNAGCIYDDNLSYGILHVKVSGTNDGEIFDTRITNHTSAPGQGEQINGPMAAGNNFFYNNTTDISVGAGYTYLDEYTRYKAANSSDGYANRAADNFKLSPTGEGVNIEIPIGAYDATTVNTSWVCQGNLPPEYNPAGAVLSAPGWDGFGRRYMNAQFNGGVNG